MSSNHSRSLEHLERLRDRTLRRLPSLRVQSAARALRFINEVGLASLFATRGLNLPCLWVAVCGRREPQFPEHSHHDPEVGLAWDLKDQLPAEGKVFYAKLVRAKPTFVAWDVFPDVYCLFGPKHDYVAEYRDGLLSPPAKRILDALHHRRPQDTFELKLATGLARPSQRHAFDAAMAELQQRLYVAMSEVRYEPFTYVWDLIGARFPDAVDGARGRRPRQAARAVAQRYLQAVIYANERQLQAVLGERARTQQAVADLVRAGVIETDRQIDGLAGRWLLLTTTAARDGSTRAVESSHAKAFSQKG
jgi:hypothetical protein